MKELIDFFIDVGKLKRKKRKGWIVLHQLETETTAEHLFRCGVLTWVLGRNKDLDLERAIKMALVHDLCEVYAVDHTPYDDLLSQDMDKKEVKELLERRSRTHYSPQQRENRLVEKSREESQGIRKLTSELDSDLKFELRDLWLDYQQRLTPESQFVKQVDKLENLLQALQYWQKDGEMIQRDLWIRATSEWITDPDLIDFLKGLAVRFSSKKPKSLPENKVQGLIEFFIEIGKLKDMPRRGWVINRVENPETIAEHIFRATIMTWILGEEKEELNIERLLKMALVHDLCEVYAGDQTPYDPVLPDDEDELEELMQTWPRFSEDQKERVAREKHQKETESLEKLVFALPEDLKLEIKNLWLDYERGLTKEGQFFEQADRVENLLQALEYWKERQNPPIKPWWLWAREFFDDPLLLEFIEVSDKKFHFKKSYQG